MPTMNLFSIIEVLQNWITQIMQEMDHYEQLHHLDEVTFQFIHSEDDERRCKIKFHYEGDDIDDLIFVVKKEKKGWFARIIEGDEPVIARYEEENLMDTKKLEELLLRFFDLMAVEKIFYIDFQERKLIMRVVGSKNFAQFTYETGKISRDILIGSVDEIHKDEFHIIQTLNCDQNPNAVLPFARTLYSYFKKR